MGSFFVSGIVILLAFALILDPRMVQSATITFSSSANIATSFAGNKQFIVVDLNGGTGKDIASGSDDDNEISWFQNNGSESFTERSVQASYDIRIVDVADLDADGDQDIIGAGFTEDAIEWWQNDGTPEDGGWTKNTIGSSFNGAYGVDVADLDGDGDLDVLATAAIADDLVWYESDGTPGNGGWTTNTIDANIDGAAYVLASDLDGDGDRDVIAGANVGNAINVYASNGAADPTFTLHTLDASADGVSEIIVADVDSDGRTDIVAANTSDNQVKWYRNNGTISAENWTGYTAASSYAAPVGVDAGDFDGDGDTDLIASSQSGNRIDWFENDGSVTTNDDWGMNAIATPTTPSGAQMDDLDEDGDFDAIGAHSTGISWLANTNIAPTLVSASITNPDDTDNVYAGLRTYTFRAVVADGNGTSNISTVRLRFTQTTQTDPPQSIATVFLYTASTNSFSRESGSTAFTVSSGSTSTSGNQLTVNWNVTFGWSGIEQDDISLQAQVTDAASATAGYTTLASSYFDTKKTLAVNTSSGNGLDVWQFTDSTLNPDISTGAITYDITYAGSSLQPPDSEVTSVQALRDPTGNPLPSDDVDETVTAGTGNDGTITVSTPSTLGAFTYSPNVTLLGGSTQTFDSTNTTVTVDRVQITDIAISNHVYQDSSLRYWDDNSGSGDAMTVSVTARLENAGTALSGETAVIGTESDTDFFGTSGAFQSGVATLSIEQNPATGSVATYDNLTIASVATGAVNVYGTTVNLNAQNDQDVGWDNAKPEIGSRDVTEDSPYAQYNSSNTTFYFSHLMPSSVNMVLSGTASDTGSGALGVTFSSEPSLATSPSDDTSLPSVSGTYTVNASSTGSDSPIRVTIADNVQNTQSYTFSYVLDDTDPTGYTSDTPEDPVTDLEDQTITVSGATDNASGVAATYLDIVTTKTSTPTAARSSMEITTRDDGNYYAAYFAKDAVGNVGEIAYDSLVVDLENEAPSAPTAGFVPSADMRLASQTPTISWDAASDADPSDTPSTLQYVVRFDDDGEIQNSFDQEITSRAGETSVEPSSALANQTSWTYAVKTVDARGASSDFSTPITFSINTSLNTDIVAVKTVGVNTSARSSFLNGDALPSWLTWFVRFASAKEEELVTDTAFPSVFGRVFIVKDHLWIVQVLETVNHPIVNYAILTLLLLTLGYAVGALRQRKPFRVSRLSEFAHGVAHEMRHVWLFLAKPAADSFDAVAPRDADGRWVYSFSTYRDHHRFSRATAGLAITIVAAKICVVVLISVFLITQAHRVIGESPFLDDGVAVSPHDTLTYRVAFENKGPAAATNTVVWDTFPDHTSLVAGSITVGNTSVTDANDGDLLTREGNTLRFSLGLVDAGESVEMTYTTRVDEPLVSATLTNDALIAWSENQSGIHTNTTENRVVSGSISGRVWADANENGAQDTNEAGMNGVTVRLYRDANANSGLEPDQDTLVASATTSTNGTYTFQGVGRGILFVHVLESSLPAGNRLTSDPSIHRIILDQSESFQSANFGYVGPPPEAPIEQPTPGEGKVTTSDQVIITIEPKTPEEVSDGLLKDFKLVTVGSPEEKTVVANKSKIELRTQEDTLILSGFAQPLSFVRITIFSEPLVFTTQADENGKWEVHVATELLDTGEHRVFAEVSDQEGRTSEQIEIAKIVVEKELTTVNIIVYVVLVGVIIILTVLVALLILRRDIRQPPGDMPQKVRV
ncbi:MAG: VCBS repeat-containing protein [Candidatus Kerfeldbacteria bacterium]|nr:VCBS repeat-containing protein [Candidatus Kerfeldbacteria bacterium]